MESSLDMATLVGGYAMAVGLIVLGWVSYHWQALRQRQLQAGSLFELILLVAFVSVVAAWFVHTL